MKNLFLFLTSLLFSVISYSQTYFKATHTEMYTQNQTTGDWDLYQKNSDVEIVVVVEDEFLSIQGKTPSMYKIYLNTKEAINTKGLSGFRYQGRDLKTDEKVTIDIIRSKESESAGGVISIIYSQPNYNLRFFVIPYKD